MGAASTKPTSRDSSHRFTVSSSSLLHIPTTRCSASTPPQPPPLPNSSSTAASSLPPPPLLIPAPEESSLDSSAAAAALAKSVPNPGPYEQITIPSKRLVNLDTHDGFRVDISKQLSPYMVAIHSFWLGNVPSATNPLAALQGNSSTSTPGSTNNSYTFVTQVANETSLLMARVDPNRGSVDGRVHLVFPWPGTSTTNHNSKKSIVGKLQVSVTQIPKASASANNDMMMMSTPNDQLLTEVDLISDTWTGNIKYGSMGGGIIYGCNYYQSLNHSWAMGGEGMYVSANQNLMSSFGVKYETPARSLPLEDEMITKSATSSTLSSNLLKTMEGSSWFVGQFHPSQGMLSINYKRLVTGPSRVTLGAELQCSLYSLDSQVAFGAEFNLTRSKVSLAVDGTGRIQSIVETKLGMTPGSPTLSFSADIDHSKDMMKFGYGLNVGG